jgi:hypothetical protein
LIFIRGARIVSHVITRLVRNCALGRVIQCAAASRLIVNVSGILDRPVKPGGDSSGFGRRDFI